MDTKKESLEDLHKRISTGEQPVKFEQEKPPEKREVSPEEKIIADELRKEIELMEVDEATKDEAKKKAEKIDFMGEKEKIEHLLQIAKEKGLVFAIKTAREMKDPYVLDILHDILAREGYYKDLKK